MAGMSRVATSPTRARRIAPGKRTTPSVQAVCELGKQVETRFRKAAARAVKQAHAADVPVAVLTEDNQVAWLHPDGVVRPTRTPVRGTHTP